MSSEERLAYLTLAQISGVGPARLRALHDRFGSWCVALAAPAEQLGSIPGISPAAAAAIAGADRELGARAAAQASELGAVTLVPDDEDYPALLRHIAHPPPLLFGAGDLALLARPAVAIVGSRDPTAYGQRVCAELAGGLAACGVVVVSGMARGLDAVAHQAALDAGGGTIGVLGNGLGVIYPAANRRLYERVRDACLLLTEFPPGERPNAGSFPRRNRLISGLARATVVVEASITSGALITARFALDQGREVLAVPGPITAKTSGGANRLIRDGAAPVLELEDLLHHFPEADRSKVWLPAGEASPAGPSGRVYDALADDPQPADRLAELTLVPPGELAALLCELELGGWVEQIPGRGFRRAPALAR